MGCELLRDPPLTSVFCAVVSFMFSYG
jgi:hypothetical protein